MVTAPEDCADGVPGNVGLHGGCNPDCTFAEYCGDGVVNSSEECDTATSGESYGEGLCTASCRRAPYCGDGSIDARWGEQCDQGASNTSGFCQACRLVTQ